MMKKPEEQQPVAEFKVSPWATMGNDVKANSNFVPLVKSQQQKKV